MNKSFDTTSKYVDKFRDKNVNNLKHILTDSKLSLNERQWESHLRNYKGDYNCPSKEEFFEHLPVHIKEKYGYRNTKIKIKKKNFITRKTP